MLSVYGQFYISRDKFLWFYDIIWKAEMQGGLCCVLGNLMIILNYSERIQFVRFHFSSMFVIQLNLMPLRKHFIRLLYHICPKSTAAYNVEYLAEI